MVGEGPVGESMVGKMTIGEKTWCQKLSRCCKARGFSTKLSLVGPTKVECCNPSVTKC